MGDLSQIMPSIHPYTGGVSGMGHSADYLVQDYDQAVIAPAKVTAMTLIDLLADDAAKAKEVLAVSPPALSKREYLDLQERRLSKEIYTGD